MLASKAIWMMKRLSDQSPHWREPFNLRKCFARKDLNIANFLLLMKTRIKPLIIKVEIIKNNGLVRICDNIQRVKLIRWTYRFYHWAEDSLSPAKPSQGLGFQGPEPPPLPGAEWGSPREPAPLQRSSVLQLPSLLVFLRNGWEMIL